MKEECKKYRVTCSTGMTGCVIVEDFEIQMPASQEEIEKAAFNLICDHLDWCLEPIE